MNTTIISLKSYTKRKNAPLDLYEMIKREVLKDEASEPSFTPEKPRYGTVLPQIKPSVGAWNFIKHSVLEFRP